MRKDTKPGRLLLYAISRGYVANRDGSVVSPKGKLLKLADCGTGYSVFSVGGPTKELRGPVKVAHLVAYQKFGESVFGEAVEVRHLDGVRANDSYENILIGSRSDNQMDIPTEVRKVRAGKAAKTAAKGRRKLSNDDVKAIRKANKNFGLGSRRLSREYGVSETVIYYVLAKKTYLDVS